MTIEKLNYAPHLKGEKMNSNMSLMTFIEYWLEVVKKPEVKISTYERLRYSAETLESYAIAQIPICEIDAQDFREYINELIEYGYPITTIKKQMLIVSAPMRYAYGEGMIDRNPCASAKIPSKSKVKKKTKEIFAYSKEDQNKLVPKLRSSSIHAHKVIELMIETGMRVGEVLALRWEDVQLERRRAYVHATLVTLRSRDGQRSFVQEGAKSETSNRVVPLSFRAVEIFEEIRSNSEYNSDYIFECERGNKRLNYCSVRKRAHDICEEVGIPYYGVHVFRHTFATNQYYKGTDVKVLSKILGHSNTAITYNVYIHLYGDGFEDMLNAVS